MPWPERVSNDDMQARFKDGPQISKACVLILLGSPKGGAIYKRESDGWWYYSKPAPKMEGDDGS
jgi:hypothetical protein